MSKRRRDLDSGRRNFLKGATVVGAAALGDAGRRKPAAWRRRPSEQTRKVAPPGPNLTASRTQPPAKDPVNQTSSGGDFMVDVLKTLDIEYLAMNCASSFRGLHEAIVNYGGNTKPEILTCPHEEIAVHMAQGYAKIEGKPMAMICHGVVGLQHATMAMYNAWCDRVPVICMGGNIIEANKRMPRRRMGALGDRSGGDRAGLRQVGRPADLASALRRVDGACLQGRHHPADGAGDAVARRRVAGKSDHRRRGLAHPEAQQSGSAAGRRRGADRTRQAAGLGAKPRTDLRPRGAHTGGIDQNGRARRNAAMRGDRQRGPHELPFTPPAQPDRAWARPSQLRPTLSSRWR